MAAPPSSSLQRMLQTAVQSVQWTYSLFWHLCPQQGILVWGDGYYNGAIKTRKTIQPMEVSAEEASLQRSQQLRELYESLSAGGSLGEPSGQQVRRPCAALSPEDLTESEWFYLMCVSFSFPPGVGLPGKAYAKRRHVWLTGANEVDSKLFTRAILAKSARVQTVLCIPLLDGVVEFGITEKVQEDLALVQHLNTFFNDYQKGHHLPPPKPALSEQSTSNPVNSSDQVRFHSPPLPALYVSVQDQPEEDEDVDDEEEDDEEEDEGEEEEEDEGDGSEVEANNLRVAEVAEPSELMQLEMSEDIRLGSPDEVSNHLESDFQLLGMGTAAGAVGNSIDDQIRVDSFRTELARRWPLVHDQSLGRGNLIPQHDDDPSHGLEIELMHEDTHYSQTVSTILNHQSNRWSDLSPSSSSLPGLILPYSSQSSFFKWTNRTDLHHNSHSKPQSSLKYILFTIPQLHTKGTREDNPSSPRGGGGDPSSRLRKSVSQDELSASHVMAERRRREKLNERFIILRSLVPFVTKMDKASILGDTIEYVKQLRNKIHDLESDTRKSEPDQQRSRSSGDQPQITSSNGQSQNLMMIKTGSDLRAGRVGVSAPVLSDKRKMRMVETSGGSVIRSKVVESPPDLSPPAPPPPPPQPAPGVTLQVQVSIIENDGLVELQCPYREGLLLDVMVTLRELGVDIVTVQSSLTNGIFVAKMRAKVKENANGRKASITEVKRAINKIIPQS